MVNFELEWQNRIFFKQWNSLWKFELLQSRPTLYCGCGVVVSLSSYREFKVVITLYQSFVTVSEWMSKCSHRAMKWQSSLISWVWATFNWNWNYAASQIWGYFTPQLTSSSPMNLNEDVRDFIGHTILQELKSINSDPLEIKGQDLIIWGQVCIWGNLLLQVFYPFSLLHGKKIWW